MFSFALLGGTFGSIAAELGHLLAHFFLVLRGHVTIIKEVAELTIIKAHVRVVVITIGFRSSFTLVLTFGTLILNYFGTRNFTAVYVLFVRFCLNVGSTLLNIKLLYNT